MTMHCAPCEVAWTSPWEDRCWNCGNPGTIGHMPRTTTVTETQRQTTDRLLRTA